MKHTLQRSKLAKVLAVLLVFALLFGLGATVLGANDDDENNEASIFGESNNADDTLDDGDDDENSGNGADDLNNGGSGSGNDDGSGGNSGNAGGPTDDDDADDPTDNDTDTPEDDETGTPPSDDVGQTEDDIDYDVLMTPSSTQDATDAATLKTLLEDNTTTVINITQDITVSDAITLGGNKTVNYTGGGSANFYAVTFNGNVTVGSGHTIATGMRVQINVGNSTTFTNNGMLAINTHSRVEVLQGGTLTNNGTLTLNSADNIAFLEVLQGGTLTNNGTVNLNGGWMDIYGTFANSGASVVTTRAWIVVHAGGSFAVPATLNNEKGNIRGVAASCFTGGGLDFLAFDLNGGTWYGSSTWVIAEPSGSMFDLTKMGFQPGRTDYGFLGWFTAATGGTEVDMTQTAYNGAGRTLYAQWGAVTTAAELITALERPGNETITLIPAYLDDYDIDINQNITLGGNKTLIAREIEYRDGWTHVRIHGGISGNFTLTVQSRVSVTVGGVVDCDIELRDSLGFDFGRDGGFSGLAAGRTISVGGAYMDRVIISNTQFENKGTINLNGGVLSVGGATFKNGGTVNIVGADDVNKWGELQSGYLTVWDAQFTDNGGTVNNKGGSIVGHGSGVFHMPTNFVNEGIIYGEKTSNFSGAFDFLTLNANGGYFGDLPGTTAVVAVQSGRAFDITKINDHIRVDRSSSDGKYILTGWFTAATGGTIVNASNASQFARAGSTLYAQWTTGSFVDEVFVWEPTEEEIENLVEKAVDGSGVVEIHFVGTGAKSARLPKELFAAIDDAGEPLALRVEMPDGTITLDADALASLIEQIGGGDVALTISKQSDSAALTNAQKAQIGSGDAVFSITLEAGGKFITEFDGLLTITLPWNGGFPAVVWYLASNGTLSRMATTYNETAKLVTFVTDHLSIYLIRYTPPGSNNDTNSTRAGSPQTGDYTTMLFPIILVALGTLGITGWLLRNRRSAKKK